MLSIRNDCDPISPDRLGQLPRRFVRASQNSSGSGIGLAIVTTIAAHCSAHLKLVSPCFATGRGFAVSLGLGILTAVVTAVTMTRMMIALWYTRARPQKLPF